MNIYENTIFDECYVKKINKSISSDFLKNNHILGYANSKINIGLFWKDELISIMTFNRDNNTNNYELLRCCNKLNINVINENKKILNFFIDKYSPDLITAYIDRRYPDDENYFNLGFKFLENIEPDYLYFKYRKYELYSHKDLNKKILLKQKRNTNKTEQEIMEELGYLRIYDCGYKKYILKLQ